MALPALLRKLFKSSGYGSELNDGIISKTISNQDWSNSYDYPVGVVARGSDDVLYYSVAQSGPGTSAGAKDPAQGGNPDFWKKFGSGDSIPTGTVLWLSTPTVPIGYLLCNGSAVGRATYPDLFAAIGTTYGAGDGSTTFNLPNLIDKFAQGSTVAGTAKNAGLPNITGYVNYRINAATGGYDGCFSGTSRQSGSAYPCAVATGDLEYWNVFFSANSSSSIYGNSDTVQPPALTLLPCIKAYSSVVNAGSFDAARIENELQNYVPMLYANRYEILTTLNPTTDGDYTITGCTPGKPIFFIHKALAASAWCYIRCKSGTAAALNSYGHYVLGVQSADNEAGEGVFVVIPTGNTIVMNIVVTDGDDQIYVYG